MKKVVLTDRLVATAKPAPAGKRLFIADALVPGFGVRVTERGHKTFVLGARFGGSKNYTTRELGDARVLTLADARKKAREWLQLIAEGKDPKLGKKFSRENISTTFRAVAERYIAIKCPTQRKGARTAREIRTELFPHLGDYQIGDIARRDIIRVIERIAVERKAPAYARNVLGHIKTIYSFAIARDYVDHAPTDHIKTKELIGKRQERTRVLTNDEIRAVWGAAEQLGYPFGPVTQLLLLTGARKSEIAGASWHEIQTLPRETFQL